MATRYTKTRYSPTKTAPAKKAEYSGMSTPEAVRHFEKELKRAELKAELADTPEKRTEALERQLYCIDKLIFFKPFLKSARHEIRTAVPFDKFYEDTERRIQIFKELEKPASTLAERNAYRKKRSAEELERDTVLKIWPTTRNHYETAMRRMI